MKRLLPLLLLLSACSPIRVKGDSTFLAMQRLAVVSVVSGTDVTCQKLADSAYSHFEQGFMAAGYRIVPRSQMQHALDQFNVKNSSSLTPNQAGRLGQMFGVQGIVIPICERKGSVDWRIQIISAKSGKAVVNSTFFGEWPASNAGVQRWVEKIKEKLK